MEHYYDLIRHYGLGIAMENAISLVKEAANDITVSNDADGVAKYLEEYLRLY